MSVVERWARTEEQTSRMYRARSRGGLCGWCGRTLDDSETVYFDQFLVGSARSGRSSIGHGSTVSAPGGSECASPELLEQTAGQSPDPCVWCNRGVFYRQTTTR